MGQDYDEVTCITAGELRSMGINIAAEVPDVGWVKRSSVIWGDPGLNLTATGQTLLVDP